VISVWHPGDTPPEPVARCSTDPAGKIGGVILSLILIDDDSLWQIENMAKPWQNHGKTMAKHGKTMAKPWQNHGKPWQNMAKQWQNNQPTPGLAGKQ
jgi:hypothetical protein